MNYELSNKVYDVWKICINKNFAVEEINEYDDNIYIYIYFVLKWCFTGQNRKF